MSSLLGVQYKAEQNVTPLVKEGAFFSPQMYEMFMYVCIKCDLDATNKLILLWHNVNVDMSFFWTSFVTEV